MHRKNVALDPVDLYSRPAALVIHDALAKVHGDGFARYFAEEYAEDIRCAVRERMRGRTDAQRIALAITLGDRVIDA